MRKWFLVATLLVAMVGLATPAKADLPYVLFDYDGVELDYDSSTRELTILSQNAHALTVFIRDLTTQVNIDSTEAHVADNIVLLKATVGTAAQGYAMTGTFSGYDVGGRHVWDASFVSTLVDVKPGDLVPDKLIIEGDLIGSPGNPILVPTGSGDWTFEGDGSDTVSIADPTNYGIGDVLEITYMSDQTLADLFDGGGWSGRAGILAGTIVPVPGAGLLGGIGLLTIGWIQRRRCR